MPTICRRQAAHSILSPQHSWPSAASSRPISTWVALRQRTVVGRVGAPRPPHPADGPPGAGAGLQVAPPVQVTVAPDLIQGIDIYPVETLARLVTHFRDYHSIEPCRAALDLDDDTCTCVRCKCPPAYAADFQDIKG